METDNMIQTPPSINAGQQPVKLLKRLLQGLTLAVCLAPLAIVAQPATWAPGSINYQGQLIQEDGAPLPEGTHTLHVTIYDSLLGGTAVWGPYIFDGGTSQGRTAQVFVGNTGRFNVVLGETDTLGRRLRDAMHVADGEARYVELQVDDDAPLKPRQRFLSTPYVVQAAQAGQIADIVTLNNIDFGIGTTPTATLDINGGLRVRGELTVNDVTADEFETQDLQMVGNVAAQQMFIDGDLEVRGTLEASAFAPMPVVEHTLTFTGSQQGTFSEVIPGATTDKWFCSLTTVDHTGYSGSAVYGCEVFQETTAGQWRLVAARSGTGYNVICTARCFQFK